MDIHKITFYYSSYLTGPKQVLNLGKSKNTLQLTPFFCIIFSTMKLFIIFLLNTLLYIKQIALCFYTYVPAFIYMWNKTEKGDEMFWENIKQR